MRYGLRAIVAHEGASPRPQRDLRRNKDGFFERLADGDITKMVLSGNTEFVFGKLPSGHFELGKNLVPFRYFPAFQPY